MIDHEELLNDILGDIEQHDQREVVSYAVDATVREVLEYLHNTKQEFGHYPVLGQVIDTLSKNVAQLSSP